MVVSQQWVDYLRLTPFTLFVFGSTQTTGKEGWLFREVELQVKSADLYTKVSEWVNGAYFLTWGVSVWVLIHPPPNDK